MFEDDRVLCDERMETKMGGEEKKSYHPLPFPFFGLFLFSLFFFVQGGVWRRRRPTHFTSCPLVIS